MTLSRQNESGWYGFVQISIASVVSISPTRFMYQLSYNNFSIKTCTTLNVIMYQNSNLIKPDLGCQISKSRNDASEFKAKKNSSLIRVLMSLPSDNLFRTFLLHRSSMIHRELNVRHLLWETYGLSITSGHPNLLLVQKSSMYYCFEFFLLFSLYTSFTELYVHTKCTRGYTYS